MSFWSGGRFLAVTAFIVAFPPVFSSFGKIDGLKLSLSILLLYFARGLFQLFVDAGITFNQSGKAKGEPPTANTIILLRRTSSIFLFSEVPLLLLTAYLGLRFMPTWCIIPYETFLKLSCPFIILAEGFGAITVILSSGQLWSESLAEQGNLVKGVVASFCITLYCISLGVIGNLYYLGLVSTVSSATLVAIVLTLLAVLTVGTILTPHGTITDSALLTLYLTYNIWIISRQGPIISLHPDSHSFLTFISQTRWSTLSSSEPLIGVISTLFNMFSVELIATIMIQMAIFIMAAKLYRQSMGGGEEGGRRPEATEWFVCIIWPCFGKTILVAVYTYAWLTFTRQYSLPIYLDPTMWRWLNVFGCLLIYSYHLLNPIDEDFRLHSD